jgi:hypothetical protein
MSDKPMKRDAGESQAPMTADVSLNAVIVRTEEGFSVLIDGIQIPVPIRFMRVSEADKLTVCIRQVAEAYAAAKQREQGWVSVEERLPPYGEYVLVFVTDDMEGNKNFVQDNCRDKTPESEAAWSDGTITYWQPLPTPPAQKGIENG